MKYPYEKEFIRYCKTEKHYSDSTMLVVNRSIAVFWKYYKDSYYDKEVKLDNVEASDIQNFLNNLETKLQMKKNTINKYLSHIRLYFTFLYSHKLVSQYPMLEINGRKFNRQHIYIINWMEKLPQIAQIENISPVTVKMMLGIGLGYFPDEVLRLRYNDVIDQITAPSLRQYITENTDFDQDPNPYILGKKFGGYYASDFHLAQVARADRKKIGMDITLQNLRLSYVYSILNQEDLTDKELKKILRVNSKTLFYYRQNMERYNTLKEFEMPEMDKE